MAVSTMLYGCEFWILTKNIIINVSRNKIFIISGGYTLRDYKRNNGIKKELIVLLINKQNNRVLHQMERTLKKIAR